MFLRSAHTQALAWHNLEVTKERVWLSRAVTSKGVAVPPLHSQGDSNKAVDTAAPGVVDVTAVELTEVEAVRHSLTTFLGDGVETIAHQVARLRTARSNLTSLRSTITGTSVILVDLTSRMDTIQ
jgi:hypothetical protein